MSSLGRRGVPVASVEGCGMMSERPTDNSACEYDRRVGVGEASRLLGVKPATLRRWTHNGRVEAFVTPGGHRRHRVSDLLRLAGGARREMRSDRAGLYQIARRDQSEALARARLQPWYAAFNVSDKEQHRERGRTVLSLMEAYLANEDRRPALVRDVDSLAAEYGIQQSKVGLSLSELLAAFHLFRRPLMVSMDRRTYENETVREDLFAAMMDVFDTFCATMVDAYLTETLGPVLRARSDRKTAAK